jgi:hypothetical protein
MPRKTKYQEGLDVGYISCANSALHFLSNADRQHVQSLAESLGVTHKDMVKVEGEDEIYFEADISSNSSYWNS